MSDGVVNEKAKIRINGNVNAAIIELSDTYLVRSNVMIKTPKVNNVAIGCNARTTPASVATPLPPLKLANTGKICPIMAAIPSASWKLIKKPVSGV
jgi:hypothetical protein